MCAEWEVRLSRREKEQESGFPEFMASLPGTDCVPGLRCFHWIVKTLQWVIDPGSSNSERCLSAGVIRCWHILTLFICVFVFLVTCEVLALLKTDAVLQWRNK